MPELVIDGKTGFLVPFKSADVLAKRVNELILNPKKRIEMGNKGRQRAEAEFSFTRFCYDFEKLFETVSNKSSMF